MLNSLKPLAFLVFSAFYAVHSNPVSYDFDQLKEAVNKTLQFVLNNDISSQNVTEYKAYTLGQIPHYYMFAGQYMNEYENQTILYFYNLLRDNLNGDVHAEPCENRSALYGEAESWAVEHHYLFEKGIIPRVRPIKGNLYNIYLNSRQTEYGKQCNLDMYNLNGYSKEVRDCQIPCEEMLTNTSLSCGISTITDKATFVIEGFIYNCSQLSSKISKPKMLTLCTYMKRQLATMLKFKRTPMFDDIRYYFLLKIAQCGPWGFAEMFSPEIITEVYSAINPDGSVGSDRRTLEEKCVLSILTTEILLSVMRMVVQEKYIGVNYPTDTSVQTFIEFTNK